MPWRALVGVFYDDGLYTVLARSLAEGHGYRMLHLPGAPSGIHYPPGYPFLLSLLWRLHPDFPANVGLFRAANALLLGLAAGLLTAYLGERLGVQRRLVALLVTAACTAVPMLAVATVLFSEPLFLVCLVLACWAADAAHGAGPSRALALGLTAGLLAGAAALTRSIGIAALLGVVVALALARQPRAAIVAALAGAASVTPWQGWVGRHHAEIDPLIAANYGSYGDFVGQGGMQLSPASLVSMARPLGAIALPPVGPLRLLLAVPALVVLLAGIACLPRRAPALGVTLAAYLVVVMAWPYGPDRFLWAALPLLAAAFVVGAQLLWTMAVPEPRRRLPRGVAAIAVISVASGFAWYQAIGLARGAATDAQRGISDTMQPALEWVRGATDRADVLASEDEALVWLYTGRRTVPNYLWQVRGRSAVDFGPDRLREWLDTNGVRRVLLSGSGSDAAPGIDALLGRYPGYLRVVVARPGGFMAFAVQRSPLPPAAR